MSEETLTQITEGTLEDIDCLVCDARDAILSRADSQEVLNFLNSIGLSWSSELCRRKRPVPPKI